MSALQPAMANVIVNSTRLVYPAQDKEITVKTENPGDFPALVQVWVDEGDPTVRAEDSAAPFLITPPLIRLEPKGGQTFRLVYVPGERALPQDKESLFYFNMLDVPPKPQVTDASYMQMAYRTRLKLFYRPAGLAGQAATAASQLTWSVAPQANGVAAIRVHNPSAYHVSFNEIAVLSGGKRHVVEGDMIAPGATRLLQAPGLPGVSGLQEAQVQFKWINDFGAVVEQTTRLAS